MKHYFLSRYLPRNFSYKGFLHDFFREPSLNRKLPFDKGLSFDVKGLPVLGIIASFCFNRLFPWFLMPGTCLLLGGCSTTSETFDCKEGKGVGCKSISEVNHMVDQGSLGDGTLGTGGSVPTMLPPSPVIAVGSPEGKTANISQGGDFRLMDGIAVHRIQEEHLRVWMAPFQDDQGNLHEGSVIHTVLKPGYWQLQGGSE